MEVLGIRDFRDPSRNGFIRQAGPDAPVEFDVCVEEIRLVGTAVPSDDCPFVQSTGYHGGNGTMQWWGNLEIRDAQLTIRGQSFSLPAARKTVL